ncbi:MAG TPA: class I SAM-dependent methyltransferase [Armatimonadota bacterium]|jgi:SAM-dependent methyltransferase
METSVASGFYNAAGVAPRNDPESEASRFAVDRFRAQLARTITPGMRVLDLGCNTGRFVFAAEEFGAVATGIDCAAIPLAHARAVAQRRGSRAQFVEGDYTALPFPPASFDAVLFINNIVECSYDDADILLRQLPVILVPGGMFCLTLPDYLAQHQLNGRNLLCFDRATGRWDTSSDIPGHGMVPHHAYFWTAAFAEFVCARYLVLQEEEALEGGFHWMVFRNET